MGAISAFLFPMIGIISIITAFVTPFMIKTGDKTILKNSMEREL
jgi:CPA2 family monovalent cation:H+ antiporter-2